MDPFHRRLIEIGLSIADQYGFALAGGYAVQAHGIADRRSEDVDLLGALDMGGFLPARSFPMLMRCPPPYRVRLERLRLFQVPPRWPTPGHGRIIGTEVTRE